MSVQRSPAPSRRAANLSINTALLKEAKAFDINLSRAAENGIAGAIADAKAALWLKQNKEALESSNAFAEASGLPLARHRQF